MLLAFYKGTRPFPSSIYSWGVRRQTKGPYSHCECIFSDSKSASASFVDGGVRFKEIEYKDEHWDFLDVPNFLEPIARKWFEKYEGAKYDLLGNLHFVLPIIGDSKARYSCAEAMAAALGLKDAWRYNPNSLYVAIYSYLEWLKLQQQDNIKY